MAFVSEIGKAPKAAFVLFCALALGGLLNLIGFASPNWAGVLGLYHGGLWQVCGVTRYGTVCSTLPFTTAMSRAEQAMMMLGLLSSIAAGGILLMFLVTSRFKQRSIAIFIMLACFGATMFNLIGVALFAADFSKARDIVSLVTLDWAFYLCVVGTVLFMLSSALAGLLLYQMRSLSANADTMTATRRF